MDLQMFPPPFFFFTFLLRWYCHIFFTENIPFYHASRVSQQSSSDSLIPSILHLKFSIISLSPKFFYYFLTAVHRRDILLSTWVFVYGMCCVSYQLRLFSFSLQMPRNPPCPVSHSLGSPIPFDVSTMFCIGLVCVMSKLFIVYESLIFLEVLICYV